MRTMRSSKLWGKITVLVAVCGWCLSAQAKYGGGSGTQAEPFRISAVPDWQELMASPADWASQFVLTADIDLNDVLITPIGSDANNFTGVFDGNDYVVRNADVNMPASDYIGLFGYLGRNGQIRNLTVADVSILGRDYVGGLVGDNYQGNISKCYSIGSVNGDDFVGGLVGSSSGTISNCYSTGSVSGDGYIGSLVGGNYFAVTINNCYSTGGVSGYYHVGGLVGENGHGATISNCYSVGSVSGTWNVGGLVGNIFSGTISNCYSRGSVSDGATVGGLVGYKSGGSISRSFWDVNTSGLPFSYGGTPKTTAEMKTQSTFTSAGWDFIEVWDIGENQTYPFLRTYLAGDINHDGVVDFRDITHLAADWLGGVE